MKEESKAKKKQNNMNNVQREIDKVAHQSEFVEAYLKEGTVGKAMKALGLARRTFYDWIKEEAFNAVYQELKADRIDELVTKLYKFITDPETPKLNQQQLLASFFLLKGFAPEIFSEKMQLQHTGKDGQPVKVTTVEIVRAEKGDSTAVSEEDLKETVSNDDSRRDI